MNIHRMLCFGRNDESGNAAIVVEDSALAEPERMKFAQRQDASATVFVEADAAGDMQLDYYYPHARSPLCLHATLAASAVFFERHPDIGRVRFVTSIHRQTLEVERVDEGIFVGVKAQPCPALTSHVAETARLLRVEPADVIGTPGLASVGSPKLLVEVAEQSVLAALRPDLEGIAEWSRKHGVSGMYVYCRLDDGIYAGRNFNHLDSRFEDAATGVAAGALALSLKRSITLLQGDALGQPCTLMARYADGTVQIGGRAIRTAI
ncbi:PhzF family phenazine biosynthesis protein [Paraburkholderia hospita]|uniref:Phenazine biosynthesis PhzC/PhzF protein n=1 Tax=Paraburkholderia hospita TaxID=169430 RepID=A0AAN1MM83_9BURK|nr:PhzF family phenazine biosynthesis protein [Paraburkholderia hospita]AUT72266.1 PhzF family phenazine biosynthesis protein [Paraburkholderia hospita]EIN00578.1 phenazine biosynthesis PhzC/PhzF protein [Paraburkholderia hospita]OUL75760.1 phenazine biosynthesis protein [Paraburkholderia hospita]OUL95034.1 phenazine biosynthesis protein [Paraburkholderia hospita]SEH95212.1 phenazine biosynthesis protein PhzF family [Paraburkholderia hospita]